MIQYLKILCLLFSTMLFAQEAVVHSVYFSFDKFNLDEKRQNEILNFIPEKV